MKIKNNLKDFAVQLPRLVRGISRWIQEALTRSRGQAAGRRKNWQAAGRRKNQQAAGRLKNWIVSPTLAMTATILLLFPLLSHADTILPPEPLTVQGFIDKMVTVHHYDRRRLINLFQHTSYIPEVIDRITRPFEEKPWDYYRGFFVAQDRIQGGVKYWHEHQATLDKVAQEYGVSPALIVAIIGIETRYGQDTGKYSEFAALATLAFKYPKRAVFFQSELEHYLLLVDEYGLSPLELRGSYAGALGIPQFMPSNYRQCAVSYEGNRRINLLENHDDAIVSIANYLQRAGWQANQPVAYPAEFDGAVRPWLISKDAKPNFQLGVLEKFGIKNSQQLAPAQKAALIAMHTTHGNEYWVTLPNFYAIMAYNPRTTYTMAIYQLSQAIETAYAKQGIAQASSTLPPPG